MHNGFVNIDNAKMSKSLNNFLMIKDILQTYHPETVRLFLLSSHYRSPIDFFGPESERVGKGVGQNLWRTTTTGSGSRDHRRQCIGHRQSLAGLLRGHER